VRLRIRNDVVCVFRLCECDHDCLLTDLVLWNRR